jgi:hypothetical protein
MVRVGGRGGRITLESSPAKRIPGTVKQRKFPRFEYQLLMLMDGTDTAEGWPMTETWSGFTRPKPNSHNLFIARIMRVFPVCIVLVGNSPGSHEAHVSHEMIRL